MVDKEKCDGLEGGKTSVYIIRAGNNEEGQRAVYKSPNSTRKRDFKYILFFRILTAYNGDKLAFKINRDRIESLQSLYTIVLTRDLIT